MMGAALSPPDRYLRAGVIILALGGAAAIYVNFKGVACLTALNNADGAISPRSLQDMERDCFIITNSYVYSLFAVVAGSVLLAVWFVKKRKRNRGS